MKQLPKKWINKTISLFGRMRRVFSRKEALKYYLKQEYFQEGLSEDQVLSKLEAAGWKEKEVLRAFRELKVDIVQEVRKRVEEKRESVEAGSSRVSLKSRKAETKTKRHLQDETRGIRRGDLVGLALRIFKVKPTRTILTILGIGVSFGTIFFLVSLGYGLQNIILQQISSDEALLSIDVFSPSPDVLPLDDDVLQTFISTPNVKKVDPVITAPGQIDSGKFASEATFYGVSEGFFTLSGLHFLEGGAFEEGKNEIVISSVFAYAFDIKEPKDLIGKKMALTFYAPVEINGIEEIKVVSTEKTFVVVGVTENEVDGFVYLPLSKISGFGFPYGLVKVVVEHTDYLEEVRGSILDMGFNTIALSDTVEQANKIFKALQFVLALFGMAALLVAVIGMINTMTIALLERINEVGIMKVLGVSDSDLRKIFLLEASIMGFLGGVSGLIMGWMGSQIFNIGINFLARSMGGQTINLFFYPIWFIVVIIVFALAVGFLTGVMPSRRAAKLDPLQALRYK